MLLVVVVRMHHRRTTGAAIVNCKRQEGREANQQQQVDNRGGVNTTGQWHIMAGVGSAWHCDNITGMASFLQERGRVAFPSTARVAGQPVAYIVYIGNYFFQGKEVKIGRPLM